MGMQAGQSISQTPGCLKARRGLLGASLPLLLAVACMAGAGESLPGDVVAAVPLPAGHRGGIRAWLLKGPRFALFHPGSSKEDEVYLVLQE